MTRKKHENAFVVDWNQYKVAFWTTNVINAYFGTYGNGDNPQKRKENNGQRGGGTNTCYFLLNEKGGHIENAKGYCYDTKTAYQAKVLNRLMRIVLEYQRYYQIQYKLRDEMGNERNHSWTWAQRPSQHAKELAESLRDKWIEAESVDRNSARNWDKAERNEKIGFNVSELDVSKKQDIKPCFFCKEYKMVDEKGHPLYVAVMLEKKDAEKDKDGKDLWFNYRVKFVGSGQPLTKFVAQVPLCYDAEKERYQQKVEEYRTANKDYYDRWRSEICKQLIENRKTFIEKFETQDVEVDRRWRECTPVIQGVYCGERSYNHSRSQYECYEKWCPHNRGWDISKIKHDGETAKKFFANAFGDAVTKLVSAGRFTHADKGLLPDTSDVNFINAFNQFCWYASSRYRKRWGMEFSKDNKVDFWNYYINRYDHTDDFTEAEKGLQDAIKTIEDWINNPNMFSFVYKDKPYTIQIDKKVVVPAKKADEEVDEEQEEPVDEPEDLKTRMAHLKECLLNKRLHMVENPAILVESPGKNMQIIYVDDTYWTDGNGRDDWWITDSFVIAEYKYIKSDKPVEQKISYRFKCDDETHRYPETEGLANRVHSTLEILEGLQTRTKLKWAPSKLFEKEQGKNSAINVLRVNENYNGVTILDPKNIKEPIACDHYEVRKIDMGGYWSGQPSVILLYAGMNKVSSIIHCDEPEQIISHIVSRNKIRQMLASRNAYKALKQYNTVKKQVQKWVAQSAEDDMPF